MDPALPGNGEPLARADGRAGGLQSPAGTGFKPRAGRNYWKKWKREKMPK